MPEKHAGEGPNFRFGYFCLYSCAHGMKCGDEIFIFIMLHYERTYRGTHQRYSISFIGLKDNSDALRLLDVKIANRSQFFPDNFL